MDPALLSPEASAILASYKLNNYPEVESAMAELIESSRQKSDITEVITILRNSSLTRPRRDLEEQLSPEDLEEILEDTLKAVSRAIQERRSFDPFHGFVSTVANRRAIDLLRKRRAEERRMQKMTQLQADPGSTLASRVTNRLFLQEEVGRINGKLSSSIRQVVSALTKGHKTAKEAAESIDMPQREFYTKRNKLRKVFGHLRSSHGR